MSSAQAKTIVFLTGAFVSHRGWASWQQFFEQQGYTTYAPPWPHKNGDPAGLRAQHPHSPIADVGLSDMVSHYATFVRSLPEKPIIIGHSAGGFAVQALLQQDLATAGVAIHPLPPLGVLPFEPSFFRATVKSLGLLSSAKTTYLMSFSDWQFAFTNGMSLADQKKTYEENVVPESKKIARESLTKAAYIDFNRPHAPLLITAGSDDNILPASLNYRNFKRYPQDNGSVTDYQEFAGRNHFVLGQPTWQEDAQYILDWLAKVTT